MKKIDKLTAEIIEANPDLPWESAGAASSPPQIEDEIIASWPSDSEIKRKAKEASRVLGAHRPGSVWGSDLAKVLAQAGVLPAPPPSDPTLDPDGWADFLALLRPYWASSSEPTFRLRCPLKDHKSSTPFSANLSTGTWFCYSCGIGGGVYDLQFEIHRRRKNRKKT